MKLYTVAILGATGAAGRCQRDQLTHREITLFQNLHHFLAHSTGGTQDSNGIQFHFLFLPNFQDPAFSSMRKLVDLLLRRGIDPLSQLR